MAGHRTAILFNKNFATGCNIELPTFNLREMIFVGTVTDEDTTDPIENASVTLYKGSTNVATIKTNANGKFAFANDQGAIPVGSGECTVDGEHSKKAGKEGDNFLNLTDDYKVEIEKKIANGNYTSVYEKVSFNIGKMSTSAVKTEGNYALKAVTEMKSFEVTPGWTTAAYDALGLGSADTATLRAWFVNTDGEEVLVGDTNGSANVSGTAIMASSVNVTKETYKGNTFDIVKEGTFFKENSAPVTPRIPDGTYYLVMIDTKTGTNTQVNATNVATVEVKDGTATVTAPNFEVANNADLTSSIDSTTYAESVNMPTSTPAGKQNDGDKLQVLDKDMNLAGDEVGVNYTLYKLVNGVKVKIAVVPSGTGNPTFDYNNDGKITMTTTTNFNYLVTNESYVATPSGNKYIKSDAKEFAVKASGATSNNHAGYAGAGCITTLKIINFPIDPNHAGAYLENVELLDEKDTSLGTGYWIGNEAVNVTGGAVTVDLSKTNLADVCKALTPGKYRFKVGTITSMDKDWGNQQKHETFTTDFFTVHDFQNAEASYGKQLVPIVNAGLSGKVKDSKNAAVSDFSVLLLKDGKPYKGTDGLADGSYAFDTVDAGTYTMIVRGDGIETVVKEITVKEGEAKVESVTAPAGGRGLVRFSVRDQYSNPLGSLGVSTFTLDDEYYMDLPFAIKYNGRYTVTGSDAEYKSPEKLSAGKYNVKIAGGRFDTYTDKIELTEVNGTGKYTYEVHNKGGNKTVALTVNYTPHLDCSDMVYAVVKNSEGEIIDTQYDNATAVSNDGTISCTVYANDTYTVDVYQNDYFVGTASVTIQDFADSVTVGMTLAQRG